MCLLRESLPVCNFSSSDLSECLTLEVTISKKKGYVITLYRSPSQTSDEFDSFISSSEKALVLILISWFYCVTLMLNQNYGQ